MGSWRDSAWILIPIANFAEILKCLWFNGGLPNVMSTFQIHFTLILISCREELQMVIILLMRKQILKDCDIPTYATTRPENCLFRGLPTTSLLSPVSVLSRGAGIRLVKISKQRKQK